MEDIVIKTNGKYFETKAYVNDRELKYVVGLAIIYEPGVAKVKTSRYKWDDKKNRPFLLKKKLPFFKRIKMRKKYVKVPEMIYETFKLKEIQWQK